MIVPLDMQLAVPSREQSTAQTAGADTQRDPMTAAADQHQLPNTASALPWVGAAGLALIMFAGGVRLIRRLRPTQ